MKLRMLVLFFVGWGFAISAAEGDKLFYLSQAPEDRIEQSWLPIGNGYFGAMVCGGVKKEILALNTDSLWTGDWDRTGAYQRLGTLSVTFPDIDQDKIKSYTRTLDIEKATHKIAFQSNGVEYSRTYFCSYPDKVMVMIFSSDKPQNAEISLEDFDEPTKYMPHHKAKRQEYEIKQGKTTKKVKIFPSRKNSSVIAKGDSIILDGELSNGLKYAAKLTVIAPKNTISANENTLTVKGAKKFVILFTTETDYKLSFKDNWKKEQSPSELVKQYISSALKKKVSTLLERHIKDFSGIYNRFYLRLGKSPQKYFEMPTDKRLNSYKKQFAAGKIEDIRFEELIAKYGRYLMISCSRPGSMPANLQGLWNWTNSPPWCSDYHSNINVEMNYWLTEPSGLSECFMPFSDYIMQMRAFHLKHTAKSVKHPNGKSAERGWAIKTENGIFGGHSFVWNFPGAAWYAQHLWEHYAFTEDKDYLKNVAYPVLKETCEFWEDRLLKRPDGTLVVPQGWSPEHGPKKEDGVTYDQEIVYDLFTNYIEASKELGIDTDFRNKIEDMRARLLPLKVGKWGQLQEWEIDRDDPKDTHRHISHLFGLHPGRQISPFINKKFFDAAVVSLKARGDKGTGWSKAWKINFWARCLDGNHAHKMIAEQICHNFYPNLFDFHPPFQIDGNFGNTAGVIEMLIQSHVRKGKATDTKNAPWIIQLLPALPDIWSDGEVHGLKARGNITVDMKWSGGKLTALTLKGKPGKSVVIAYNNKTTTLKIPNSGILKTLP